MQIQFWKILKNEKRKKKQTIINKAKYYNNLPSPILIASF